MTVRRNFVTLTPQLEFRSCSETPSGNPIVFRRIKQVSRFAWQTLVLKFCATASFSDMSLFYGEVRE